MTSTSNTIALKRSPVLLRMAKRARSASTSSEETARPRKAPGASKPSNLETCTIVSWNCETSASFVSSQSNTLSTYFDVKSNKSKPTLRTFLQRHDLPAFLCLQEVRAKADDKDHIAALRHSANEGKKEGEISYTAYFSLCQLSQLKGPKRFGVATYVRDDITIAAAREVDWDAEGRVLILELQDFALVNVYALNGSNSPWKDAQGITRGTRNERKREFNRLLMQECLKLQKRGLKIVLIGDFNISLTKLDCYPRLRTEEPHALARKEFNEVFMPTLQVVDVYRRLHGDTSAYSWFAKKKPHRSDCARVDFALIEEQFFDHVVSMQYLEEPSDRGQSDHCPLKLVLRHVNA